MSKQMVNKIKIMAVLFVIAFSFMFVGIVNFAKAEVFDLYSIEILMGDAEVRVEGDDGINGLFFKAQMDADQYDALKSRVGEGKDFVSMETGLIIAPVAYENHYELCEDTLFGEDAVYDWAEWDDEKGAYVYNGTNSYDTKIRVININANDWVSNGDYYVYEGGMVDVLPLNVIQLFESIAYVSLVDAGGETWRIFSDPCAESVVHSMQKQYDSFTDDQKAWVDENWASSILTIDESTWDMIFQTAFSTEQFTFQTYDHATGEVSALGVMDDTIIVADGLGNTATYFTTTEGTFVSVNNGEPQLTDKTMEEITAPFMQDMMAITSVYEMRDKVEVEGAIFDSPLVILLSLVEDGKNVGLIELNMDNGYIAGLCISRVIGTKEHVYIPMISPNPGGGPGGGNEYVSYMTEEEWLSAFDMVMAKTTFSYQFVDQEKQVDVSVNVSEKYADYNELKQDGTWSYVHYDFVSMKIYEFDEFGNPTEIGDVTSKEDVINDLIDLEMFFVAKDHFGSAYCSSGGEFESGIQEFWNADINYNGEDWNYSISFLNGNITNISVSRWKNNTNQIYYCLMVPQEVSGGDDVKPDNPDNPNDYLPKIDEISWKEQFNKATSKTDFVYVNQNTMSNALIQVDVSSRGIEYNEHDGNGNYTGKFYDFETMTIYVKTDVDMIASGKITSIAEAISSVVPLDYFFSIVDDFALGYCAGGGIYDGIHQESWVIDKYIDGTWWHYNIYFQNGELSSITANVVLDEVSTVQYHLMYK